MISAGVEGRLPYMTYSEPWSRSPPKPSSEVFLRPAPKLLPPATRCTQEQTTIFLPYRSYNGMPATTYPNGTRIAPSRPISKYPSPPPAVPVNLTQPKEEPKEEPMSPYSPYRLFQHPAQYSTFPYPSLCQQPYMLRPSFPATPLSPQEMFSPATPTASGAATFLSPPATFSPPSSIVKHSQGGMLRREKRNSPVTSTAQSAVPHSPLPQSPSFKVPSGKEGSMKHRLLTRPEDAARSMPLDLQKPQEGRKRLTATISPPRSPKKQPTPAAIHFQKGLLVSLTNGEVKRIEDMRTEDFIKSAEENPALRLAESTVVKINEGKDGHVTITLAYDQMREQVESDCKHPYYVIGHGWASCNPDRTLQCHGLKVHRLQVGDVLVSLTPRKPPMGATTIASRSTTIMTTATTTAMSARQYSGIASSTVTNSTSTTVPSNPFMPPASSSQNHRPLSHSPPKSVRSPEYILPTSHQMNYYTIDQMASFQLDAERRKRRWSAPDAIEEQELARRNRVD
uniref:AXH domain-containing protein n=1 Tax=Dendroctonus ponderosae TaxID=77166 RepID=A0AAR5Q5N6_DENPD